MHLPHRISAIGAIVGYLPAGHQHRITACSRNILVEKGDIAQIVTLEFIPVALVGIEIDKPWMTLTGPVIGRQQQPDVAILVYARCAPCQSTAARRARKEWVRRFESRWSAVN